eukprot:CAMPEP_0173462318 /NCGR_PEP_ID=MMETSP1357-20121228/66448_1 /TAXON_ID=77926 /ORGANISM="Hemiselmis rufescens, Strain PCC563" /LENGTH=173 /DNA_ID=CAMNT_0014430041 /DNA_START=138 /DNA_END=660 /DNA_ORIENTATION=-
MPIQQPLCCTPQPQHCIHHLALRLETNPPIAHQPLGHPHHRIPENDEGIVVGKAQVGPKESRRLDQLMKANKAILARQPVALHDALLLGADFASVLSIILLLPPLSHTLATLGSNPAHTTARTSSVSLSQALIASAATSPLVLPLVNPGASPAATIMSASLPRIPVIIRTLPE